MRKNAERAMIGKHVIARIISPIWLSVVAVVVVFEACVAASVATCSTCLLTVGSILPNTHAKSMAIITPPTNTAIHAKQKKSQTQGIKVML